MKTTVEVQIDIEDVYSELTYSEQQEFVKSHIDDIGGLEDVVEQCFDNDTIKEFVEANIDKLTDEVLINEIKNRGVEV